MKNNKTIPRAVLVDVSPKTFGVVGFILFFIAVMLVVLLSALYGYLPMFIGIGIFICGGFSGRCIQKQLDKKSIK